MLTERERWIQRLLARADPAGPKGGARWSRDSSTCPLYTDLLEFIAGEAVPETAADLEHHLRDCATCQSSVESLRQFLQNQDDLPEPAVEGSCLQEMSGALKGGRGERTVSLGAGMGRTGDSGPRRLERRFPGRLASVVGGALAASVVFWALLLWLRLGGDGVAARGGQGAWTVTAILWTGHASQPGGQAQTNRDPATRLLLLTSSQKGLAWSVRLNTRGLQPLPEGRWVAVQEMAPLPVPLTPPEAGVDTEWFISLVVSADRTEGHEQLPPPERLDELSKALTKAIEDLMRDVFQAVTREREGKLQEDLARWVKDATGAEVRVAVCHWKVRD